MSIRIAVIDEEIPNQDSRYRYDLHTWVTGARQTLQVGENDRPGRILAWIQNQALVHYPGETLDLDLISHGAGPVHGTCRPFWVKLGRPGITHYNVHNWFSIRGLVRKIRVYACGVLSDAHPRGTFQKRVGCPDPQDDQHLLMRELASHTGAQVKYSFNTMLGSLQSRGSSQSFDLDPMLPPVFIVYAGASRRQLR
jgi:hypothetical protein